MTVPAGRPVHASTHSRRPCRLLVLAGSALPCMHNRQHCLSTHGEGFSPNSGIPAISMGATPRGVGRHAALGQENGRNPFSADWYMVSSEDPDYSNRVGLASSAGIFQPVYEGTAAGLRCCRLRLLGPFELGGGLPHSCLPCLGMLPCAAQRTDLGHSASLCWLAG